MPDEDKVLGLMVRGKRKARPGGCRALDLPDLERSWAIRWHTWMEAAIGLGTSVPDARRHRQLVGILTQLYPMMDVISAYKQFDRRASGWTKVELRRES